jgi:predicted acylesterase/phospholipase RssA
MASAAQSGDVVSGSPEKAALTPEPGCEEIRLALAMNGGVSLAVWMGGCTTELDRARHAHDSGSVDSAYEVLAKCFGRRLTIDILTGTSAGGINAALLGGAITHKRELRAQFLRDKWIELGDLGRILHDQAKESPTSLMDGKLFHEKLRETFEGLFETEPTKNLKQPPIVPSLDVTMTDVMGVERRFRDAWGGELIAREHRPRFRFRRREHFTKQLLADAARTSASFPFAFEPWRVTGSSRVLAGLPSQTWGIDGGLLDNAPIRDALALIPTRPASAVVRRYFCYVNGDPTVTQENSIGPQPGLQQVGGYAVNLPRAAPLVDHLYAIRDAVERPARTAETRKNLLGMNLAHLEEVAASLFSTYRKRRTLESLEAILPEPRDAKGTFEQLQKTGGSLPWIPKEWRPGTEASWEWGLLPAQRILHLALDLLRAGIDTPVESEDGKELRRKLLRARIKIDEELGQLRQAYEGVTRAEATIDPSKAEEEGPIARVNAACREATAQAAPTRSAVEAGVKLLRTCMTEHRELSSTATLGKLFGIDSDEDEQVRWFIRRALSIEVVQRAFASEAEIESCEELRFVQLTPQAPAPVFSPNPLHLPGPATADEKLTGVALGHFAAFYRRSWRANDFMWGRLDAAARMVDLLLDSPSPDFGEGAFEKREVRVEKRAEMLANFLIESADEDRWLIKEALAAGAGGGSAPLTTRLKETIEGELTAVETEAEAEGTPLPVTRALFQRIAQAEILRAELPVLVTESANDRRLGSGAKPLLLDGDGCDHLGLRVKAIRQIYAKSSLPKALTGEGEEVSDLGLQTITHASFVSLAAIRTAGVPMSKFFGFARPPLLAIAGTVASRWWVRATAALGFWAAAMFLASRMITAGTDRPAFSEAWSPTSLVMLAALSAIIGFVLVPGMRFRNGLSRFKNAVYAVALALSGVGAVAGLALIVGNLEPESLLFSPDAESPPEEVLWLVLGLLGAVSLARFPLPGPLKKLGPKLGKIRLEGRWMCLTLTAAFVLLSVFTVQTLVDAFYHGLWHREARLWQGIAAAVALGLAPVAAFFAVSRPWVKRKQPS